VFHGYEDNIMFLAHSKSGSTISVSVTVRRFTDLTDTSSASEIDVWTAQSVSGTGTNKLATLGPVDITSILPLAGSPPGTSYGDPRSYVGEVYGLIDNGVSLDIDLKWAALWIYPNYPDRD
jgi:hypothetical protein